MIRLKSAGKTDVGLKREENEDNFIMLPDHGLYVLADGMGGHVGGKMASTLAVTLITEFIAVRAVQPDFQWEYPPDENVSFEANVLVNAIKYANERIFIESCKDRAMEGMGTTVTAVLATDDDFILAHVGDSRIYRMRDGDLTQMTIDHSLLNHMIEIGEIRRDEAHKFANKNVILRAVGLKDYVDVSVRSVPKVVGDTYLLCSDGLSDLVEDPVIRRVLVGSESLPAAVNELIQLALRAGGKDNITVVCIEAEDVPAGEEQGWGTGTFTRKQAEAAAAYANGSGPPSAPDAQPAVARPRSPQASGRRLSRPTTPTASPPPPQRPRSGAVAPPRAERRTPGPGNETQRPTPRRDGRPHAPEQRSGPEQRASRVNGERMHAVRTPMRARRQARSNGGGDDLPPRRTAGGGMPAPPPRQRGMAPAPPRRGGASTPPAPLDPVDAPGQSGFEPRPDSAMHNRQGGFLGSGPSSRPDDARRSMPNAGGRSQAPGRRRTTPADIPAYSPPHGFEGDRGSVQRPTSGGYAPPQHVQQQQQQQQRQEQGPSSGTSRSDAPPPGGLQRTSSGIFQAPPPGVFPPASGAEDADAANPPPSSDTEAAPAQNSGKKRDTVQDVPLVDSGSAVGRNASTPGGAGKPERDTVREIPIVSRGQTSVPAAKLEEADSDKETTLVPQISRGQTASDAAPPAQSEERSLGKPQSGEGEVAVRQNYREDGSVMVDSSLFTETQDDEDSVVIDDSLLMEIDEEDEITHKGPPPPPPSSTQSGQQPEQQQKKKRDISNRPTELLPITGARQKS